LTEQSEATCWNETFCWQSSKYKVKWNDHIMKCKHSIEWRPA